MYICKDKPYVNYKVYGPYKRKDGRLHVIVYKSKTIKHTVSYPKFLMEIHLGKKLHPKKETVDHIDSDFTNNDISNLRILDLKTHTKEDAIRLAEETLKCKWCKTIFIANIKDRFRRKAGPFCSKKCTGTYGAWVQNTGNTFNKSIPKRRYYKLKDL